MIYHYIFPQISDYIRIILHIRVSDKSFLSLTAMHTISGVTTRGEVTQLPQGGKRQGVLGVLLVDGLFALHYRNQPNF